MPLFTNSCATLSFIIVKILSVLFCIENLFSIFATVKSLTALKIKTKNGKSNKENYHGKVWQRS